MKFPKKISLGNFPTKLAKFDYLSSQLDVNVYIKYECDADSHGYGNKVRKLEYLYPYLLENGYTNLVLDGIIQSNSCAAISHYSSLFGIKTDLILTGKPDYFGNHASMILSGSNIHYMSEWDPIAIERKIENIVEANNKSGLKTFVVPTGVTSFKTVFGSIDLIQELKEQQKDLGIMFNNVLVPVGTGGTLYGLVIGNLVHKIGWEINGILIANDKIYFQNLYDEIAKNLVEEFEFPASIEDIDLEIHDGAIGKGYSLYTAEDVVHIKNLANHGLYTDTIYMNKAVLGLKQLVKSGKINEGSNVVLIHTGGLNQRFNPPFSIR